MVIHTYYSSTLRTALQHHLAIYCSCCCAPFDCPIYIYITALPCADVYCNTAVTWRLLLKKVIYNSTSISNLLLQFLLLANNCIRNSHTDSASTAHIHADCLQKRLHDILVQRLTELTRGTHKLTLHGTVFIVSVDRVIAVCPVVAIVLVIAGVSASVDTCGTSWREHGLQLYLTSCTSRKSMAQFSI